MLKPDFIEFNANTLVLKTKEMPSKENLLWNDIEWIKFEKNGTSFYPLNSFNSYLSNANRDNIECKKIQKLITEIATEKNIKLIAQN